MAQKLYRSLLNFDPAMLGADRVQDQSLLVCRMVRPSLVFSPHNP